MTRRYFINVPFKIEHDKSMHENRIAAIMRLDALSYLLCLSHSSFGCEGDDFCARHGWFAILIRILRFKANMFRQKQMGLSDFFVSVSSSLVVCILPNAVRGCVCRRLLR